MLPLPRINKSDLRAFFRSDRAVLLACMGIALLFWLLVKLSQDYRAEFSLELKYGIPEEKTFLFDPVEKIEAMVSGSGWDLLSNQFRSAGRVILEIKEVDDLMRGSNWLKARIRERLNGNLEVVDVNPEFIRIQLVEKRDKKVPIRLRRQFSFASGFHLKESPRITPDSVTITGPAPLLDTLSFWTTDSIKRQNINSSLDLPVPLTRPGMDVIRLSPSVIRLSAPVEELTEKILFIPVQVKNAPDSIRIFPEKIRVSSIVGLSDYNLISPEDFTAEVDMTGIKLPSPGNTLPITMSRSPEEAISVNFFPKSTEFYVVRESVPDSLDNPSAPPK